MNVAQVIELLSAVDPGATVYVGADVLKVDQVLDADNGSGVTLLSNEPPACRYVLKEDATRLYWMSEGPPLENHWSYLQRDAFRFVSRDAADAVAKHIGGVHVVRVWSRPTELPGEKREGT